MQGRNENNKFEWVAIDIETHPDYDGLIAQGLGDDPLVNPSFPGLSEKLNQEKYALDEGPKLGNLKDPIKIAAKEAEWKRGYDERLERWENDCEDYTDNWYAQKNKTFALDPLLNSIHMLTVYRRKSRIVFSTQHMVESEMLVSFWDYMLNNAGVPRIITCNGRKFDAKVLYMRSTVFHDILNPVEAQFVRDKWLAAPWKTAETHIDIQDPENYGMKSLAFLAKRVLGREKGSSGGGIGVVPGTAQEWKEEEVYCMGDSRNAYDLALKLMLFKPDAETEE